MCTGPGTPTIHLGGNNPALITCFSYIIIIKCNIIVTNHCIYKICKSNIQSTIFIELIWQNIYHSLLEILRVADIKFNNNTIAQNTFHNHHLHFWNLVLIMPNDGNFSPLANGQISVNISRLFIANVNKLSNTVGYYYFLKKQQL